MGISSKSSLRYSSSSSAFHTAKEEVSQTEHGRLAHLGFSLVELLTVIAIMGLLAAAVLPAVNRTKVQGKTQQARLEMAQLLAAISEYESAYNRFPVSAQATRAATISNEDITYGAVIEETHTWLAGPGYFTNNCEILGVLLDLEYYGDGAPTINKGHIRNPQRTRFLQANQVGGTNAVPGIGRDGIYRDPWGSPYIITLDLNRDGRARDVMYREPAVSADPASPERGLFGLTQGTDSDGKQIFEYPGSVMIWSAGPDRHVSIKQRANEGVNRDNVLSWSK